MSEELERRVIALEQKASDDNNMVLKKAPNFANRLVEALIWIALWMVMLEKVARE